MDTVIPVIPNPQPIIFSSFSWPKPIVDARESHWNVTFDPAVSFLMRGGYNASAPSAKPKPAPPAKKASDGRHMGWSFVDGCLNMRTPLRKWYFSYYIIYTYSTYIHIWHVWHVWHIRHIWHMWHIYIYIYMYVYIYIYIHTYDIQVRISYRFSEYHGFSAPVLAGMQLGGPGSGASFGISAVPGAADGGSRASGRVLVQFWCWKIWWTEWFDYPVVNGGSGSAERLGYSYIPQTYSPFLGGAVRSYLEFPNHLIVELDWTRLN